MRKFNIFTVFFAVVTIISVLFSPFSAALEDPGIQTGAALLVEKNSGNVLYKKNENMLVVPGCAARIMTMLLAVEAIENGQASLLDNITPSDTFMEGIGEDDTVLGIKSGETMKLQDLLYSFYISGCSDAGNIVAEYLAGDVATFVAIMNSKAGQLGCGGTHFTDPGGMDRTSQYTTLWDQYLIFKDALEHQLFIKIAGEKTYYTEITNYARERKLENVNLMLNQQSSFYYEKCIVGCTNPYAAAGNELLSYAEDGELSLISMLYGSEAGSGVLDSEQGYVNTRQLLEWGFNNFAWQIILDENEVITSEDVELADESDRVDLRPDRSLSILVRTDLTEEDIEKQVLLFAQQDGRQLTAPISEGTVLGKVIVLIDGDYKGTAGLIAAHEIGLNEKMYITSYIKDTLAIKWVQISIGFLILLVVGYLFLVFRDIRKRWGRRRVMEETKRKIIEDRKKNEKIYR